MEQEGIIVNICMCVCVYMFMKILVLNLAGLQSVVGSEILACTFLIVPPTGGRATAKAKPKLAAHLTHKGGAAALVTESRCRPRSGRCCTALCCIGDKSHRRFLGSEKTNNFAPRRGVRQGHCE